ncbi:MAG TPA: ATP-binding protein [Lamprocystis sp. (in: g-proteobacteria)]|nr:ATP-binding protein [Lamprocystis sp. (in: g-proteobacteria)]
MKQLVILGGKGGTGKTSVTAALAHLASLGDLAGQVVLADADVDAANLELVLKPRLLEEEDFRGGQVALIDPDACVACGECESVCRFAAIHAVDGYYVVDPIACDGCAACVYQCPTGGIAMHEQVVGKCFVSDSRCGPLYHATLFPGQENSGKLVTLVKQRARQRTLDDGRRLLLVDGPPGIGCPVIAAVSGADLALIVTEPTVAGIHDLCRTLKTVRHFGVRALVCINKADLYPAGAQEIDAYCRATGVDTVGTIPFDLTIAAAMVAGEAVTAFRPESPAAVAISAMSERVDQALDIGPTAPAVPGIFETSTNQDH